MALLTHTGREFQQNAALELNDKVPNVHLSLGILKPLLGFDQRIVAIFH